MRRLPLALAVVCAVAAAIAWADEAGDDDSATARGAEIAAWTREYATRRAGYYLADARKMLDKAIKHFAVSSKGGNAPDPYLKVWDAQSQLSAALSWDDESADLWFEAGNLTFTLAGLMRELEEGDLLQDALAFWAQALRLEAGAGTPGRPLARRLRAWLGELAAAQGGRRKLPMRLWLAVNKDAWKEVQHWDVDGSRPPPSRAVYQRRPGRVSKLAARATPSASDAAPSFGQCSSGAGAPTADVVAQPGGSSSNWLTDKVGAGREIVFPTYISRSNLLQELGRPFFEKLSTVAASKYSEFRKSQIQRYRREHGNLDGLPESKINDAFFQFQETHEHTLRNDPKARQQWPELYGSEEFETLVALARNASLAYLRHSGAEVTPEEVASSWVILWTAVYPQDPHTKGRHGWHTHQESIISGVLYANPRHTPLLFADPRGAPPIQDYEQYRLDDLLFEPKAPFDANYQFFAEQGDLVLFPSWLVHKVPPPVGKGSADFRVVFPFNFHLGTGRRSRGTIWDGWERTVPI